MAWPKKRRILRAPFLLALALPLALVADVGLGTGWLFRLPPLDKDGWFFAWIVVEAALLPWGLWRVARPWWLRAALFVAGAALAYAALMVGYTLGSPGTEV